MTTVSQNIRQDLAVEFRSLADRILSEAESDTSKPLETPWWTFELTVSKAQDGSYSYKLTFNSEDKGILEQGATLSPTDQATTFDNGLAEKGWAAPSIPGGISAMKEYFEKRDTHRGIGSCGISGNCG